MQRKQIGVTLLVCAVLASGLIAAGMVATNGLATDETSDASTDTGTVTQTLNVTVYADVQGQMVPIQGANVTVYEVTVTANDTVETITIEKIAVATTGVGGIAQIVLPEGDYTIVADYYGLRSVGILSNDTAENITMVLNSGMGARGECHRGMSYQNADNNTTLVSTQLAEASYLVGMSNGTVENTFVGMSGVSATGEFSGASYGPQRRH
jgi:hypothetical protein